MKGLCNTSLQCLEGVGGGYMRQNENCKHNYKCKTWNINLAFKNCLLSDTNFVSVGVCPSVACASGDPFWETAPSSASLGVLSESVRGTCKRKDRL